VLEVLRALRVLRVLKVLRVLRVLKVLRVLRVLKVLRVLRVLEISGCATFLKSWIALCFVARHESSALRGSHCLAACGSTPDRDL
jgi:hypothetical protein